MHRPPQGFAPHPGRFLPHAYVASLFVAIAACGGSDSEDKSNSAQIVACEGEGCWNCGSITIKSVTRTACEKAAPSDAIPQSYDCTSNTTDTVLCPPTSNEQMPIIPIIDLSDAGAPGTGVGYSDSGSDADANPGTGVGYSDSGTCSGGGSPCGDSGATSDSASTSDAGTSTGGGYHCESESGTIYCEGPPTCPAGSHLTPCGKCVPDVCDSCTCPSTDGGTTTDAGTPPDDGDGCTRTQGYWKTHPNQWPVSSLVIGGVNYGKSELITILKTPTTGDASLILAHQLIAAKLNVLSDASTTAIEAVIIQADAWMAANKDADGRLAFKVAASTAAGQAGVALSTKLDTFNNGNSGVPHCD